MRTRYYLSANLPVSGFTVCYLGNTNKDWPADKRVSWWVVPGTMKED